MKQLTKDFENYKQRLLKNKKDQDNKVKHLSETQKLMIRREELKAELKSYDHCLVQIDQFRFANKQESVRFISDNTSKLKSELSKIDSKLKPSLIQRRIDSLLDEQEVGFDCPEHERINQINLQSAQKKLAELND